MKRPIIDEPVRFDVLYPFFATVVVYDCVPEEEHATRELDFDVHSFILGEETFNLRQIRELVANNLLDLDNLKAQLEDAVYEKALTYLVEEE